MRDSRNYLPRMVSDLATDQDEGKQLQYFGYDALGLKQYHYVVPANSDPSSFGVYVEIIVHLDEPKTSDVMTTIGVNDSYYDETNNEYSFIVLNMTYQTADVYITYFGQATITTRRLQ